MVTETTIALKTPATIQSIWIISNSARGHARIWLTVRFRFSIGRFGLDNYLIVFKNYFVSVEFFDDGKGFHHYIKVIQIGATALK